VQVVTRPSRRWLLSSVAVALPLAGFVGLTAALAAGALLDLDVAVRNWCDTHRPAAIRMPARASESSTAKAAASTVTPRMLPATAA
jgi:hypothetical protein